MPEIVEAKPVARWNLDHLFGSEPEMILDQHVRHARLLALEPVGSEDEVLVSRIRRGLSPVFQQAEDQRM